MKEKVILNRPSGAKEERKVIAHFKALDDSRPNIKNVPILILDKQEMNNGNNVLEFMWEKNGVYQAINDENAWSEVKSVVVDIIKNNAKNINYISDDNLKADIGSGRSLGLTVAQTDPLAANFKTIALASANNEVSETLNIPPNNPSPAVETVNATPNVVVNETPVVNDPVGPAVTLPSNNINEVSQVAPAIEPVNEDVITPFANDVPIESVISQEPVVENVAPAVEAPAPTIEPAAPAIEPVVSTMPGPEIIPEPKDSDFDKMQQEIEAATREYQEKIKSIVDAYKKKITETINEANNLKEQATDHLKNAQAREQIANMAYQNSMELNNAPSLQKIA